jgi:oxygen-independent coproporphyrinogen-3 oxidase
LLPDEDLYADAFLLIHEQLNAAGYNHYEIANYARDGQHCRHNAAYWQRKPYLGIGAGAHSFLDNGWGSRWQVPNDLDAYRTALKNHSQPATRLESFNCETALKETVYLALRTRDGVHDKDLQEKFKYSFTQAFPEAAERCSAWLTHDTGRWSLTPHGWLIFDNLIQHFL